MNPPLYPQLESSTAPLDESDTYTAIIKIDKDLTNHLRSVFTSGNPLDDVPDKSILPDELLSDSKKGTKTKRVDVLKRLKELTADEPEDEEEPEDEDEDEEEVVAEDEEDDAGGDYLVSHFDNGEGYEDNDDEGDEMIVNTGSGGGGL